MNKFASKYGKHFVFIGLVFFLSCNEKKLDIQNENSQKTVFSKNEARFIEISEEKIKILDLDGQLISEPIDKKSYFAKGEFATLWKDKNFHLAKQWESESICRVLENNDRTPFSWLLPKLNSKYKLREISQDIAVFEGLLPNKPSFLIAKSGSLLVDEKRNYYKIYDKSDELIRVMKNDNDLSLFGFIDSGGKEIIPCIYEIASDFSFGIAAVKTKKGWSVINSKGKVLIPFKNVENISVVDAKTLLVSKSDGKYALLKIDSESEIEMGYKKVIILKKSALLIGEKETGQKEIVNSDGKIVLNMLFDEIIEDSDGILRVELGKKWGILNTNNDFFVKPVYEKLSSFDDDRALSVIAGEHYIINSKGETVKKLNDGVSVKFINDFPFCR